MSDGKDATSTSASPFMPMFEAFRKELDEHHDRRERVIKASRDVTAASKKIIFTLQRVRNIAQPLHASITKPNTPYHTTISSQLSTTSPDLQGLNAHRYARQISGGAQEYVEAASFQHYLETATLLSYDDAVKGMREICSASIPGSGGDDGPEKRGVGIELSYEDYLLGIYDMTGELMRFAITTMATSQSLPTISSTSDHAPDAAERNILTDLRHLRAVLESLDCKGGGPFAKDVEKKAEVMRASVEKVERALYGLTVRGAERPKGWMPDLSAAVEVEG